MASTEAASAADAVQPLAQLDAASVAMLGELVADSGWNQLPEDWALFHAAGTIHVIRDDAGRIVASGAVLPMDEPQRGSPRVAWISMILVHTSQRGRGLGRAVFARCLQQVQEAGRIAMLDATPAGEALYRQFGFETQWRLTRWRREARAVTAPAAAGGAPGAIVLAALAELDQQAQGFGRRRVLEHLGGRPASRCARDPQALALVRAGRGADHVGPVLAASEDAAAALFTRVVGALPGAVLADVPDQRPLMRAALQAAGFEPQRGFARMALIPAGQALPAGRPAFLHAVAGPEFA